jgi:phenylacetate 2-hydroxylase
MSRFALNTSLAVNYGCRFDGIDDQLLSEIIYVESNVSGVRSVTAAWSDYVPLLRYIPKGNTVSHTEDIRRRRDKYMGLLLDDLKDSIKKGTDVPCITGNILKDPEVKLTPLELSSICLSMVSAGLDTLGNTMIWTVGFLAQHPQIWEKAYAEVNKVFDGAVPDCDTESVEYITAIYREALRYFSVLKLSLPRATIGESEYKGVVIPDGTTVFLNAWAVHHDESRYGDVDVFRPERFMEEKEDGSSQAHYSFGAGRRMCAGVHLANRELYSAISKLVYFFKLEEGDVPYGCDPAKDVHNTYALAHTPHKYKMRFVARDPEMLERWIQDEKGRNELKLAGSIGKKA